MATCTPQQQCVLHSIFIIFGNWLGKEMTKNLMVLMQSEEILNIHHLEKHTTRVFSQSMSQPKINLTKKHVYDLKVNGC